MLAAHLRNSGISVVVDDQNLRAFKDLLDVQHVRTKVAEVRQKLSQTEQHADSPGTHYRKWVLADLFADRVLHRLPGAMKSIQRRRFRDPSHLAACYATIAEGFTVIEAAYPEYSLGLEHFSVPLSVRNAVELMARVNNPEGLPFLSTLEHAAKEIAVHSPRIVGLSIISDTQLLAALVLAKLIRRRLPHVHITAGGAAITYLGEKLANHPKLFGDLLNSFVTGNGELALEGLVKILNGHCGPDQVPNIYWRDNNGLFHPPTTEDSLPLQELPLPDYTGLDPNQYLSPRPGVCMSAFEKGCYWGKCAFCFENIWYNGKYHPRRASRVAEQMQQLSELWGITHFELIDLAIAPRHLGDLGDELSAKGLNFTWTALTRAETQGTSHILERAHLGGCVTLLIGFESASDRVLKLMRKGLPSDVAATYLQRASAAGIWIHAYIIVGFPGETRDEAYETLRFVDAAYSSGIIHSVGASPFTLCMHTTIYNNPERFGITIQECPEESLNFEAEFSTDGDLDDNMVSTLVETYNQRFEWPVSTLITATMLCDNTVDSLRRQITSAQSPADVTKTAETREYRWNIFTPENSAPLKLRGDPLLADWSPV